MMLPYSKWDPMPDCGLVPERPEDRGLAQALAMQLRRAGYSVDLALVGHGKKPIQRFHRAGVERVLVLDGLTVRLATQATHQSPDEAA